MILNETQRADLAQTLPEWTVQSQRDAIERHFTFQDFVTAFQFMTDVAIIAEEMNHHPEWFNVWNTVQVVLSTHDVGGLSALDVALAQAMDRIYQKQLQ